MSQLTNSTYRQVSKLRLVRLRFWTLVYRPFLASCGDRARLGKVEQMTNPHRISLGKSTVIYAGARLDVIGPPVHRELGSLTIGDGTSIEPNVHIGAATDMVIGRNVVLASSVYITDHDHGYNDGEVSALNQPLEVQRVTIEDNVWIGERGVVLKGVTIGHHSIVGANSVVTRSIPPFSIAVGSPARVVRTWCP